MNFVPSERVTRLAQPVFCHARSLGGRLMKQRALADDEDRLSQPSPCFIVIVAKLILFVFLPGL